ncbi:MAG: tetratricopeptide repeat protein [Pirellulaceae bacterium]|nr:tetratricopeptide repeat protein [Pirellulaceae bacterium]
MGSVQLQADTFESAESCLFAGDYQECLTQIDTALADGDNGERWYLLRLECLLMTGEYEKALETLEEGLRDNPNSIQLRLAGSEVWKLNNNMQRGRELLVELDELLQYRRWRYRDAWNQVTQGRYQLLKGADAKEVLDKSLTPAALKAPDQAVAFLAMGDLALAKNDYALAEENYRKATELQPENPAGFLGLAKSWRPSDFEKSGAAINRTMELNPNYVPGLQFLVNDRLDSERYDEALQFIDRIHAINPQDVTAWIYRAVVAHIQNDPDQEAAARKQAFSVWQGNPQVDYLIGKKLSQRYRFAEGAKMQRRALTYDAKYLPAKVQLANDLLRLGNDEEGWRLADEVYQDDGYNVVAYNLVTLGKTVADYSVLERDGFIVRMEPAESDLYGEMVLDLLSEAKNELCEKYQMKVAEPIFVEIFPNQQDFAIRTFGMPGGAGYLGVCFGRVITMNSPKSQVRSGSNWKSVLWHEFCHVVTLQKTGNKMPRWLSEGISVYEERQRDPSWGQVMSPAWRERILGGKMTPVSELSSAFVKPDSGDDLQFAYFQSSLVIDYLVETYGISTLNKILVDLNLGMPINEVLSRYTGDVRLLDREFFAFATQRAEELAAEADWSKPEEMSGDSTIEEWQAWNLDHPDNVYGLRAEAALLIKAERWDEAKKSLQRFIEIYPGYRGGNDAWSMLAGIARAENDDEAEYKALQEASRLKSGDSQVYERLIELAFEAQNWDVVALQAQRWLALNPLIPAPHRAFAEAAESTGDYAAATRSLKALTLMDPFDPAETFYRYALALQKSGEVEQARRQILKCLEQAPRYRKAHQLLQDLNESNAGGAPNIDAGSKVEPAQSKNLVEEDP